MTINWRRSSVPDTTPEIPDEAVRAFRDASSAMYELIADDDTADLDFLLTRAGLAAARPYLVAAALRDEAPAIKELCYGSPHCGRDTDMEPAFCEYCHIAEWMVERANEIAGLFPGTGTPREG